MSGVGSGAISGAVHNAVDNTVKSLVESACANAQSSLDDMIGRKQDLIGLLQMMDAVADAHFASTTFVDDGIVLYGAISLSPRKAPQLSFEKTVAQDGFSALLSWMPGGRIDRLDWSWSWAGQNVSNASKINDRFVLLRASRSRSGWGQIPGLSPGFPGIDGAGSLCLRIEGAQVDPVTGEWAQVSSAQSCKHFSFLVNMTLKQVALRPLSREAPQPGAPSRPDQLLAIVGNQSVSAASNTLVLYVDGAWTQETALALRGALEGAKREGAALTLLALFRDSLLGDADGPRIAGEIEAIGHALGIATIVNEDVAGGWAAALVIPHGSGEESWRLLAPLGGVTWTHQGRISAKELAEALDRCLLPTKPPRPGPLLPAIDVGARLSPVALVPSFGIRQAHCPPPPVSRLKKNSVVTFVRADSAASQAHLRTLAAQYGKGKDDGPMVLVVAEGAANDVARIQEQIGADWDVVADREGAMANRFGVRVWPTTLTLDQGGVVAAVEVGARLPDQDGKMEPRQ